MLGVCWVIQHIAHCPIGPSRRTNRHLTIEVEGHGTDSDRFTVWMLIIARKEQCCYVLITVGAAEKYLVKGKVCLKFRE